MDFSIALKNSSVTGKIDQDTELHGNPVHLTRHEVLFEIYSQDCILQISQVLDDFRIVLQDKTVFQGRAIVKDLINNGLNLQCSASLDDGWTDIDSSETLQPSEIRLQFQAFFKEWQKNYCIRPEYKIAVADIQTYLMDLRDWLSQLEIVLQGCPENQREQLENSTLQELKKVCLPGLNTLFDNFEAVALTLEQNQKPFHQHYLRRQLHPLLLIAPFVNRTFFKPLGFAGDYEMVNMIARNRFDGDTLFAKMVNCWFLNQAPAEAHRNRINLLEKKLIEETVRASTPSSPARILNLGCGPAAEVQNFLRDSQVSNQAELTLLDFNDETIAFTRSSINDIKRSHHRHCHIEVIKKSVQQVLRESARVTAQTSDQSRYDFIYCAGLYDYLSDVVCKRLNLLFYQWLNPGGLVLLTNVNDYNPRRQGMEAVLEWNLNYRNGEQVHNLCPQEIPEEYTRVYSEISGVNIILEFRKPYRD